MNYHTKYSPKSGYTELSSPPANGLALLSLGMLRLTTGDTYEGDTQNKEIGFNIISGTCDIAVADRTFKNIGRRRTFFGGKGSSVYMPPKTKYKVIAKNELEVAISAVPVEKGGEITLSQGDSVDSKLFGRTFNKRRVNFLVYENVPAKKLIVGEAFHYSGRWSGYPPHKHDENKLPKESSNEEIYLIKVEPPEGFGFAAVYDREETDLAYRVTNNSVLSIPHGYHPMVSAPGYKFGFLWFMAGEKRVWKPTLDPDHAWYQ
jgi:5-deoxy-glucuronate isomerase